MKACRKMCYTRKMHHGVVETCLDCFLSGGFLYVYRYGMSMRDLQLGSHVLCLPAPPRNRNQRVKLLRLQKKSWKMVLARTTSYLTTVRTSQRSARQELPSVSKLTVGRLWHVTCCEAYSNGAIDLWYKQLSPILPLSNRLILFLPE